MNFPSNRLPLLSLAVACLSANALAATHSENFNSASGSANAYGSASGMYFSASGGSFLFSSTFNSYYSPYIAGKFMTTGCDGCYPATMNVSWPSAQRTLSFGWGTQNYPSAKVTGYLVGSQVWQSTQSGSASGGLYKQQFSYTAANAGQYFDHVAITFTGGGQGGTGYGILLDNFSSSDAYAALQLSGGGQFAPVSHAYGAALAVEVHDYLNQPVVGVQVTFTTPNDGLGEPTALFASNNGNNETVATDANGLAVSSDLTANDTVGAFQATVSVARSAGTASYSLRNVTADTIFVADFE